MGVGVAKEGERLQATSTPSAGLWGGSGLGCKALQGPRTLGNQARQAARPLCLAEEALSTTYRHAREDGVSPSGAGALPWLSLGREEPGLDVAGMEAPWEADSGRSTGSGEQAKAKIQALSLITVLLGNLWTQSPHL